MLIRPKPKSPIKTPESRRGGVGRMHAILLEYPPKGTHIIAQIGENVKENRETNFYICAILIKFVRLNKRGGPFLVKRLAIRLQKTWKTANKEDRLSEVILRKTCL